MRDLKDAEEVIIRYIQQKAFAKEMNALKSSPDQNIKNKRCVDRSSPVYRLDPILDNEMLKVGERLGLAGISYSAKHQHQIILSNNTVVSELILREIHQELGHSGRMQMLGTLQIPLQERLSMAVLHADVSVVR